MKFLARLTAAGAGALALMLVLGGAASPAEAAGAAVYVGDYDPVYCANPSYQNIQDAVNATPTPSTIYVCDGGYDPFEVSGKTNMKIIAKGEFVGVIPPYATPATYTGPLVYVHDSTNITIQGFYMDGNERFAAGKSAGIVFENASGSITKNHILRIRQSPKGATTTPVTDGYTGIWVSGNAGQKVKIASNTISDYESLGIYVTGNAVPTISGNLIINNTMPGSVEPSEAILLENVSKGTISGNKIRNDYFNETLLNLSVGIQLYASSNVKVTKNSIVGTAYGIMVYVDAAPGSSPAASKNLISGNTLTDTVSGITVEAWVTDDTTANPRADMNKITGNKLTSNDLLAVIGIGIHWDYDTTGTPAFDPFTFKNTISGNKLYGFMCGCFAIDPGDISTIVGKNTFGKLPTGAGAAPSVGDGHATFSGKDVPHHGPTGGW